MLAVILLIVALRGGNRNRCAKQKNCGQQENERSAKWLHGSPPGKVGKRGIVQRRESRRKCFPQLERDALPCWAVTKSKTYDVVVAGAGVFGAWTALHLARRGQRVLLVDAYGPANARASSGGESRIIRMGYGADELYTRWAMRSLVQWKELFASVAGGGGASPPLFHETGVLWIARDDDAQCKATTTALRRCNVPFELLGPSELHERYPQIWLDDGLNAGHS